MSSIYIEKNLLEKENAALKYSLRNNFVKHDDFINFLLVIEKTKVDLEKNDEIFELEQRILYLRNNGACGRSLNQLD